MRERQEREQEKGRRITCQLQRCQGSDKKKLPCLAFESITVVWLSSYRSLSVNAVSPTSYKKVCMCVLSRDCDQCDSESA